MKQECFQLQGCCKDVCFVTFNSLTMKASTLNYDNNKEVGHFYYDCNSSTQIVLNWMRFVGYETFGIVCAFRK